MHNPSPAIAASGSPPVHPGLKTPRAAAIAGILFSTLLMASFWLLWSAVPANPLDAGAWLEKSSRRVSLALNLIPFAGVAFWFVGVLRDRLGRKEDQFFSTVLLGSGLMFLGMLFVAASAMAGLILAHASGGILDSATFVFARAFTYNIMHVYALKMAAVFMITTSTLALITQVTPRWIAFWGYASAVLLILGSGYLDVALFLFPAWVLLVSVYILIDNLRRPQPPLG